MILEAIVEENVVKNSFIIKRFILAVWKDWGQPAALVPLSISIHFRIRHFLFLFWRPHLGDCDLWACSRSADCARTQSGLLTSFTTPTSDFIVFSTSISAIRSDRDGVPSSSVTRLFLTYFYPRNATPNRGVGPVSSSSIMRLDTYEISNLALKNGEFGPLKNNEKNERSLLPPLNNRALRIYGGAIVELSRRFMGSTFRAFGRRTLPLD